MGGLQTEDKRYSRTSTKFTKSLQPLSGDLEGEGKMPKKRRKSFWGKIPVGRKSISFFPNIEKNETN